MPEQLMKRTIHSLHAFTETLATIQSKKKITLLYLLMYHWRGLMTTGENGKKAQFSWNQPLIQLLNFLMFTGRADHRSLDHNWWYEHRCHASRGWGCARSHSHVTWCSIEGQRSTGSFDWHSDLGNSESQKNSRRKSGKFVIKKQTKRLRNVWLYDKLWKNYPLQCFSRMDKSISKSFELFCSVSVRKWCHTKWRPACYHKAHAWIIITLILSWWMMGRSTNMEGKSRFAPVLRTASREKRWKNRAVRIADPCKTICHSLFKRGPWRGLQLSFRSPQICPNFSRTPIFLFVICPSDRNPIFRVNKIGKSHSTFYPFRLLFKVNKN